MKKGKKRYTKKDVQKSFFTTLCLMFLVSVIGFLIMNTEWLRPKLNEISASYISLNNTNKTDMLKITNLRKLSDKKGISKRNKSSKDFQITGQKEEIYQIVLYHLGYTVDEKFIHYSLTNEKDKQLTGILSNQEETFDGGRIIFEGTMQEGKNWNLKMWIDSKYNKNSNNISYEIRIKTS